MASSGQNSAMSRGEGRGIVSAEANFGKPSRGELEAMARRRFQDPAPKEGRELVVSAVLGGHVFGWNEHEET
jgi:hypothetical protein